MKISGFLDALKDQRVKITLKDGSLRVSGRQHASVAMQLALLVLRPRIVDYLTPSDRTDTTVSPSWIDRQLEREYSLLQITTDQGRRWTSVRGDDGVALLLEELDAPYSKRPVVENRPELFRKADGTIIVRAKRGDWREPVDRGAYAPARPSEIDYNPPRDGDAAMHRPRARRSR